MKKILLGAISLALFTSSCQRNDIADNIKDVDNQFQFGVYQGKATKAAELTNNELIANGVNFPLHAYKGAMNGTKTKYFTEQLTYGSPKGNQWNTSIPRFLTEKEPMQFFAYYANATTPDPDGKVKGTGYVEPVDLNSETYPTMTYSIQEDGKVADLVAASVIGSESKKVMIPFRHILSQINFGVKGFFGAKITITDIKIKQVKSVGKFDFTPAVWGWADQATDVDYDYTFPAFTTPGGVYNNNSSKWEDTNAEGDNKYIFGDGGKFGAGKGDDVWYVTAANTATQGSKITNQKLSNSLMLMPQAFTQGMTTDYVTFKYTITDLGGAVIVPLTDGKFDLNTGDQGLYANEWKPNLRYIYMIDFTGYLTGQLLSFTVDVDSQPWENYDGEDGTGIIYLPSTGEPVFDDVAKLKSTETLKMQKGNVFSDLTWDWSTYFMNNGGFTAAGQSFTLNFESVAFNGNKVTIDAPIGFAVSNGGVVNEANKILTFTSIAAAIQPSSELAANGGTISVADKGVLYANAAWTLEVPTTALNQGDSFTFDASNVVWMNGFKLTLTAPAGYKLTGFGPLYTVTKE